MDRVLKVPFQQQQTSVWCWAAVAAMVSGWYSQQTGGARPTQCAVAAATLGVPSCCPGSSIDPNCLRLWGLDLALQSVGHFAGKATSGGLGTIAGEVNANRPLGALIQYPGVVHFVLVSGYSDTQELIVVCDPAGEQPFSIPVTVFFSNYNNSGSWGAWYFTS